MRRKYWSALLPLVLLGVACQEAEEPAELAPATTTSTEAKILFDSGDPAGMDMEIYVMETDGSNVQRITHTPVRDAHSTAPNWSPDSRKIAFDSTRDGNFEIYVMDADGSNLQRITHNDKVDARPAWSPDGLRIVFHSKRDGSSGLEIYVMDADGGNVERLTDNNQYNGHPDW
jgi:Tol biopolymer transport system component